jgi:hypothetical protein
MEKISIEELMFNEEIERDPVEERATFESVHSCIESIAEENFRKQLELEEECLSSFGWTRYDYYEELQKRDMKQ